MTQKKRKEELIGREVQFLIGGGGRSDESFDYGKKERGKGGCLRSLSAITARDDLQLTEEITKRKEESCSDFLRIKEEGQQKKKQVEKKNEISSLTPEQSVRLLVRPGNKKISTAKSKDAQNFSRRTLYDLT